LRQREGESAVVMQYALVVRSGWIVAEIAYTSFDGILYKLVR
jgi:hypothetical protein